LIEDVLQKYEYKPALTGLVLYFCHLFIQQFPVRFFSENIAGDKRKRQPFLNFSDGSI